MSIHGTPHKRPVRWGLVLVIALAGTAWADYPESFKTGMRAVDFHAWSQVAQAMREAIAEQPRATGENVRIYGVRVAPYIPQYFLGLALFRQGDYAGAATALGEAEAQGTVHGLFRGRLEFFQEVCARRLGGTRPVPTPSRPSPGSATSPVSPSPGPPGSGPVQAPAVVRQKAIEEAAREARDWLARGESLVGDLQERHRRDPRKFERDPTRTDILEVAERRLQAADFLLEGCRKEGDLGGVERARDDAHAAWEMLDELAKGL